MDSNDQHSRWVGPPPEASRAWHFWTDGGASWGPHVRGRRREGWGLALYARGLATPTANDQPLLRLCGLVVLDAAHPLYVGACRLSNNDAELCSMLEVVFYILGALEDQRGVKRRRLDVCIQTRDEVCIHPDSKYAMCIAEGLFLPLEHVLLGYLRSHIRPRARQRIRLRFEWTWRRSTDAGNKMADSLAAMGMDTLQSDAHMKERLPIDEWGAQESRDRLDDINASIAERETLLGQEAEAESGRRRRGGQVGRRR